MARRHTFFCFPAKTVAALHLFEFLALRFLDELGHKEYAEDGEEGIDGVGGADADAALAGKYREAPGDDEVRAPLSKSAYGDSHGTDAVVEHFAEHNPHDRAPRHREEGDVEVRRDEGDNTRRAGEAAVGIRAQEADGEGAEGNRHANATDKQERLATNLVDKHDGCNRHDQVDTARNHAGEERVALAEPDALPKHGTVVENHVDTHELLQDGKAETRPYNRGDTLLAADNFEQVGKLCGLFVLEGVVNGSDFLVHALGINPREDFLCLFQAAFLNKITRRFRKPPGGNAVKRSRNDFDPEHNLPGLEPTAAHVVRRTRDAHDEVVREQRHEDTNHDGELLHGAETPAQVSRSRFGNVDRRDDASDTDTHAADDTPHDKVRDAKRDTRTDSTHKEESRSSEHATDTAELVGKSASEISADRGTDQRKRNSPGKLVIRRIEMYFESAVRTVDNGGIEAEQEAADSSGQGDQDYVPKIRLCTRHKVSYRLLNGLVSKLAVYLLKNNGARNKNTKILFQFGIKRAQDRPFYAIVPI